MAAPRLTGHQTLINRMHQLGYKGDPTGVCRGISFIWILYALVQREADFFDQIDSLMREDFLNQLLGVEAKIRRGEKLADAEKKLSDVKSMLEGVELFFNVQDFQSFVGDIGRSDKESLASFVAPDDLKKMGGLKRILTQSRYLSATQLKAFFWNLQQFHKELDELSREEKVSAPPIAISFRNEVHEFNLKFDSVNENWLIIDSNNFPDYQRVSSLEELPTKILQACFHANASSLLFNVEIFSSDVAYRNSKALQSVLAEFKKHEMLAESEISKINSAENSIFTLSILINEVETYTYILRNWISLTNLSIPSKSNLKILLTLIEHENIHVLERILEEKADFNQLYAYTPSIDLSLADVALSWGKVKALNFLRKKAKISFKDFDFAIECAILKGHTRILPEVCKHESFPNLNEARFLNAAIASKNINAVRCLVQKFGVNLKSEIGDAKKYPLHGAISLGCDDIARYIANTFPECINQKTENGVTPLMLAAFQGQIETMDYLFNEDAEVIEAADVAGAVAADYAVRGNQHHALARLHYYSEATISLKATALFSSAVELGAIACARFFHEQKISLDHAAPCFEKAIIKTVICDDVATLSYIVSSMPQVKLEDIKNENGYNLAIIAVLSKKPEMLVFLSEQAASFKIVLNNVIYKTIETGNVSDLQAWLARKVVIDSSHPRLLDVLRNVIKSEHIAMLRYLKTLLPLSMFKAIALEPEIGATGTKFKISLEEPSVISHATLFSSDHHREEDSKPSLPTLDRK